MAHETPLNQSGAVQPQAEEDLGSAGGVTVDENPAREKGVWDDAVRRVRNFQGDTEQYVRENPTKAVFTALGVGFVLALMFRR